MTMDDRTLPSKLNRQFYPVIADLQAFYEAAALGVSRAIVSRTIELRTLATMRGRNTAVGRETCDVLLGR